MEKNKHRNLNIDKWYCELRSNSKRVKLGNCKALKIYLGENFTISKLHSDNICISNEVFSTALGSKSCMDASYPIEEYYGENIHKPFKGIIRGIHIEYHRIQKNFCMLCLVELSSPKSEVKNVFYDFTDDELTRILKIDTNAEKKSEFNPEMLIGKEVEIYLNKIVLF